MSQIQVMSSAAIKPAYLELVPAFERASGHKVETRWIPGVDVLKRVKEGESSDLVIMQAKDIDALIAAGRITAGSRVDLATSGVGIAVRAGAPRPDISSADALKRALLAAKAVAFSTGPSGVYILELFERLGIAAEIKGKSVQIKGEPSGAAVARGDAEIAFQQVSELLPVTGIDYIGPLPSEIQRITTFSAGVQKSAPEPAAAQAWIKFLTSSAAAPALRKSGMEPA
ncbi:MAG TPA: substrate-binding domain-containing protein [Burkholderiales bacterium]|nr:substrate-binding domain-containing protein [Burkholderiales bacterium]